MEINGLNTKLEDEQALVSQLQKKIKELNVRFIPIILIKYVLENIFNALRS